jgi:hypothetical protein
MDTTRRETETAYLMDHLRAWGAPVTATTCDGGSLDWVTDHRLRAAIELLDREANWSVAVSRYVVGRVLDGDAEALRAWSRQALVEVGLETAEERDPAARQASAEAYADAVMDALDDLADLI